MTDTISIPLGGRSKINLKEKKVGPESVGYKLVKEGLVFVGSTLTATDIAVANGNITLGNLNRVKNLSIDDVSEISNKIKTMIEELIDKIKTSSEDLPVILVGGGAILINGHLEGATDVIKPKYFDVANAIGPSIAEVGGKVDQVFYLDNVGGKENAVKMSIQNAQKRAIEAGADRTTLRIVNVEEYPIAYLPGNATRIKVKVVGNLNF